MFMPWVFAVMVALLLPGVFPKQLQCTMEPDGSCSLIGSKVTADEILSTSFGSNPEVNTVQFSRSTLSAIPPTLLQSFPNLEVLNGSACDIKQVFSRNFASGKKLRELYLRGNKIHELPEEAFFGPSHLRTLDLSSNSIVSADRTVFRRLRELKTLLLGENELSDMHPHLFDDLTELESLHLQQNKLRAIDDRQFARCTSLTHLNVSHNAIKTFHLPQFERRWLVDLIDASYNALTTVSIPSNLRQLVATGNSIRKVERSDPHFTEAELVLLKLPHNKLDSIDSLPTFENLIILDLSYNQIRDFDFQSIAKFKKLTLLNLDGNQLDTVSNSLAQPITNPNYVYLADNRLVRFDLDILRTVQGVLLMDLRRNQLERLSVTDLNDSFPVMVRLLLDGNRLRCEDNRKLLKALKSSVKVYPITREDCAKDKNLINGLCCS